MSDYSCEKHGHDFHEDCVACEAADDWASKNRRIAELTAERNRMQKALKEIMARTDYKHRRNQLAALWEIANTALNWEGE